MRRSLLPLGSGLLVLLLLTAGCDSLLYRPEDSDPQWVDYEVAQGPPRRDMIRICNTAIHRAQFPTGVADEVAGVVTSGWFVNLSPYSFKGYREQAVVEIKPGEGTYEYLLRVRVKKELNKEVKNTMEATIADWDPGSDNVERAEVILEHIKAQLRGGQVPPAPAAGGNQPGRR